MSYSDLYTHQHSRWPHILAVLAVLAVSSAVGYYFLSSSPFTRASDQNVIRHQAVNVLPRQVGIYWEVETADKGWIVYGESPSRLENIALDEQDTQDARTDRIKHFAMLKNLNPETTYYYKIVSNDGLISDDNNEPFSVQTISDGTPSSTLSPAYGKVISQNGEPLSGSFVFFTVNNAVPLVAMTKSTGEWLIPLQFIVNTDDYSSVPVSEDTVVTIRIFNDSQQSLVKATLSQTHPIPQTLIIGSNYSFIGEDNVLSATTSSNSESSSRYPVTVQYPKNNAVIPGTTPLVKGNGVPGEMVQIQVNTKPELVKQTRIDNDGNWNVSMNQNIAPGTYTLSMRTRNSSSRDIEIKRRFTIIKSGERVLGESTPEATLSPTEDISPTIEPSPTIVVELPTAAPTISEGLSLTPTTTPAPPVSGISMIPVMIAGVGLILLGAGVMLVL